MDIRKAILLTLVISSPAVNAVNKATPVQLSAEAGKTDNLYVLKDKAITIPADIVESGYQLIGASYVQNKVVNHFNQVYLPADPAEKALTVIASSKLAAQHLTNSPFAIFTFADGITAYAAMDFVDMGANIHLKFTKLIDKNGNVFNLASESPFHASKSYDVAGMSLASWRVFRSALQAYDLIIPGTSDMQVPDGIVTIRDCSSSTDTLCHNPT